MGSKEIGGILLAKPSALVILLNLLFLYVGTTQGEEWHWPVYVKSTQPVLNQRPSRDGAKVWESTNLIIVEELDLSRATLGQCVQTMDSLPRLMQQLSLPLWAPPKAKKAVVRICKNEASFSKQGGPAGAAGCYDPRSGDILIRGDFLLKPPHSQTSRLPNSLDEDLLVHELCHQAMHQYIGVLPAWLSEGIAEYFAACHTSRGNYDFSHSNRFIKQHIWKYYPRKNNPTLKLPPLEILVSEGQRNWIKTNQALQARDRYRWYAASLLLVHYYLEGGDARRDELTAYLVKAKTQRGRQALEPLLKDTEMIEKRLVAFWKKSAFSLDFTFTPIRE